jgi:hypothetical protein
MDAGARAPPEIFHEMAYQPIYLDAFICVALFEGHLHPPKRRWRAAPFKM